MKVCTCEKKHDKKKPDARRFPLALQRRREPTAEERHFINTLEEAHCAALGVLEEHDARHRMECPCAVCGVARAALELNSRIFETRDGNLYVEDEL